jgi:DNA polymerase-3 subunit gamma/tau
MSYEIFARKYRPRTFEEVVGQPAVVQTLRNALKSGRVAQAYLFSGMRGTGKTTVARILAKALNCKEGPTPVPCNACESCLAINEGRAVDVIEIDGASNRGIEDIRSLREALRYGPLYSRHKVVIIDEVHQITKEGFNALLKTLEEPLPGTVFIFATTEFHKVLKTIVSRCQHFEFKRIGHDDIVSCLRRIAEGEGITISQAGLSLIAQAADGSLRDAQSLLDQAVSFSGENIPDDDLKILLGTVSLELLLDFSSAVLEERPESVFPLMERVVDAGYDLRFFFSRLVEHFRTLLVVKTVESPDRLVILTENELAKLREQAAKASADDLLRYLLAMHQAEAGLRYSALPRVYLETFLIRLCRFKRIVPLADLMARLERVGGMPPAKAEATRPAEAPAPDSVSAEKKAAPLSRATAQAPDVRTAEAGKEADAKTGTGGPSSPRQMKEAPASPARLFDQVLADLSRDRAALAALLREYSTVRLKDDLLEVLFASGKGFLVSTIQPENIRAVEKLAAGVFGRPLRISFGEEKPAALEQARPVKLSESALKDPAVRYFMETFQAQVLSVDPAGQAREAEPAGPAKPGEGGS